MLYIVYTRLDDDPEHLDTAQVFRSLDDARQHCTEMDALLGPSRLIMLTMIDEEIRMETLPTPPTAKHNA